MHLMLCSHTLGKQASGEHVYQVKRLVEICIGPKSKK
jgi:hypothetical protein